MGNFLLKYIHIVFSIKGDTHPVIDILLNNKKLILGCVLTGFLCSLFNAFGLSVIMPIVFKVLELSSDVDHLPKVLRDVVSFAKNQSYVSQNIFFIGLIFSIFFLKTLFQFLMFVISQFLRVKIIIQLRQDAMEALLNIDYAYFSKVKSSEILKNFIGDIDRFSALVSQVANLLQNIFILIVSLTFLLNISTKLSLVSMLGIMLILTGSRVIVKRSKKISKVSLGYLTQYMNYVHECLNGVFVLKMNAKEESSSIRHKKLSNDYVVSSLKGAANNFLNIPYYEITGILFLLATITIAKIFLINSGELSTAGLFTFMLLLFQMFPSVKQISSNLTSIYSCLPSVEKIYKFLNDSKDLKMQVGKIQFQGLKDKIELVDVGFSYDKKTSVLQNINLTIKKGETAAIVGESGGGKSTLSKLLLRLYDPLQGAILYDGINLKDYDVKSIRKLFGVVGQSPFLFNDTIRNNLLLAKENASKEEIEQALIKSNSHEFVYNLPKKLDTTVGERGLMLSGGQKQRLAIARAIIHSPEILLLDEATSSLDTSSEKEVQVALYNASQNRTMIIIAHRLSTIKRADKIVVLNRGKVVEIGNYEELMGRKSYFYKLNKLAA